MPASWSPLLVFRPRVRGLIGYASLISKSLLAVWVLTVGLFLAAGCSREPTREEAAPEATISDAPLPNELPPLELRDETADLLLTWIDAQGDFHVVQKPSEVPDEGREQVRVVVTTKEEGSGKLVYVADLRTKGPEGNYPVKTMTRAQWNEIGAERRKVRMDELAQNMPEVAKPPAAGDGKDELTEEQRKANSKVKAVVYGADWCKPCHIAEDFLRKLGVDVTKKDIEESRAARAEMQQKLAAAGRMGASIPVMDIGGKILVGFSESAVRRAVAAANKPETL